MKTRKVSESRSEDSTGNVAKYFSFTCLKIFQNYFNRTFYNLGYVIGGNPSYFIIIPVFLTLLGITGVQRIHFENDPDKLFIPTDGLSTIARDTIEKIFPMNSSYKFDPSRLTRNKNFAKILITAKDNGTMLRTEVWKDVILLDELIQNMTIEMEGQLYNYSMICSSWEGSCFPNIIYNLNDIISEVENRTMWISYPVMLFPLVLPLFFGGVEVNETEGILISTNGVYTVYFLAEDNWKQRERAHLWEGELLKLLESAEFDTINIARYASRSLADELQTNTRCVADYLPLGLLLLLIFSILSVSTFDWVRNKVQMGVLGLFTIVMASCASFGFLIYLGIPFVGINLAALFLILGIGLDDMFTLLYAWRRTNLQHAIPERLAEAYSETAVAVSVSSLTNLISFFIGTLTTFPAIRIFCIYLGSTVLFTYIWFLTFFGGCLAIMGYMERDQKHVLSCKSIKAKSQIENDDYCYGVWCAGGINKSDPWNVKDNKPSTVAKFFRDYYGKALNLLPIKIFVLLSFGAYLGGALYGCFTLQQGVDRQNMNLDGSYLNTFYKVEDELFRKFPYRIQVVIKGNLTFSDEQSKLALLDLHSTLENISYVGPRLYTRSWIRGFYSYLRRRPHLNERIKDEKTFIRQLKREYLSPHMRESLDVVYNEDETRIVAARFIIQGYEVKNMDEDKEMVRALREVSEKTPFETIIYHPTFVFYDQYLIVDSTAVKAITLAAFVMVLTSFFFVPNPLSSVWIGFSVISINFGVIGYMSLWSVRLDTISLVNLIMTIGFSVDYSAHFSHSYLNSKASSVEGKVRLCLYKIGLPVLQSGLSTIIAVVVFIFTPSYIYRTFFKIIFLVTIFGMAHSLVLLPVLLSLFDRGLCRSTISDDDESSESRNKTIRPFSSDSIHKEGPPQNNVKYQTNKSDKELGFKGSSLSSRESSLSSSESSKNSAPSCSKDSCGTTNLSYTKEDAEVEHL